MVSHANRVPQNPNRKKITPEGEAAYYATVENADNPVTEGAVVNKMMLDEFLAASGTTAGSGAEFTLAQEGFSLFDGALVRIKLNRDMVAGATLNVNGTGAKAIVDGDGNAVGTWLKSGAWVDLVYNSATGKYVVTGGAGERYKPGDVLLTARNPGSEWVLCNGGTVSGSTYPDLTGVIPATGIGGQWTFTNISTSVTSEAVGVAAANGYWVAAAGSYIFYTTNPFGTWTAKQISGMAANSIKFLNGYFVVCSGNNKIFYATNPAGTWTAKEVGGYSGYSIADIDYGNNYWAAVGGYYDNETNEYSYYVFYCTSLTGSWGRTSSWSTPIGRIFFEDGKFITGNKQQATTPNSSWSSITINTPVGMSGLVRVGSYWVSAGNSGIAYSTALNGSWTTVAGSTGIAWARMKKLGNEIVACGSRNSDHIPFIAYATSPIKWEIQQIGTASSSLYGVDRMNGIFACAGGPYSTPYKPQAFAIDAQALQLPNIEIPGVKAYMKAKK